MALPKPVTALQAQVAAMQARAEAKKAEATTTEEIKTAPVGVMGAYTGALQPVGTLQGGVVATPIPAVNKQIIEEVSKSYDEQVAQLPHDTTPIETKPEFVNRAIKEAVVTIATIREPSKAMETRMQEIENATYSDKFRASMIAYQTGAIKEKPPIASNIGISQSAETNPTYLDKKFITYWNNLSQTNKAVIAGANPKLTTMEGLKVAYHSLPVVTSIDAVKKNGWASGWTWASIAGDVLILSPVISKALGLAVAPIKGNIPRVGMLQVGTARVGGLELKVSRMILLDSKNAVANFEKLRIKVSRDWAFAQQQTLSCKEGEVLLSNSVMRQLEGLPYKSKTIIEYPFKLTTIEQGRHPIWGYSTKRPGAFYYTTPVDEALVKATNIPEIGSVRFGEGGGYGREGQWSKAQFEAETARVKAANILEKKPWELNPEVKAAIKKEKEAAKVATATKERIATEEKFKTITEKKPVVETRTSSETERLEMRREYAKPKPRFTGVSNDLVIAISTLTMATVKGKTATYAPSKIQEDTDIGTKIATQITPDIQTLIDKATKSGTVVDSITQAAIEQALKSIARMNTAGMTNTQINNAIKQQVRNSIKNQIAEQTESATKTELATKTATMTQIATRTATKITTLIRDRVKQSKIRGKIRFPVILGDDGKPLTEKQVKGAIGWKQGWIYKVVYPPYSQKNVINSKTPIEGIRMTEGVRSAYSTLVRLGGKLPHTIKRDMGIMDIIILTSSNREPTMRVTRDIRIIRHKKHPAKRRSYRGSQSMVSTVR